MSGAPGKDTTDCKQPAGIVAPVIDSHRCEGKQDCVRVCPYDVFEVRELTGEELPPPLGIPELPKWVREYPGTNEELLAAAVAPPETPQH